MSGAVWNALDGSLSEYDSQGKDHNHLPKRDFRVADQLLRTTGGAGTASLVKAVQKHKSSKQLALDSGSVLAPWVMALSHHDQRILISAFRGMDQGAGGADSGQYTTVLVHALRQVCQAPTKADFKVDGHYLGDSDLLDRLTELVNIKKVRREIEHVSNHYLDHLLNPLFIVGRELGQPWRGWYEFLWRKLSFPTPDWTASVDDKLSSAV